MSDEPDDQAPEPIVNEFKLTITAEAEVIKAPPPDAEEEEAAV
jgi:hypothetical protein